MKIEIGLRRCGHCVLGIENDVNPIVSGAGYRNVCHGRFSPKVAEHLHSSSKNTKNTKSGGFCCWSLSSVDPESSQFSKEICFSTRECNNHDCHMAATVNLHFSSLFSFFRQAMTA